jgi:hypothetical protein
VPDDRLFPGRPPVAANRQRAASAHGPAAGQHAAHGAGSALKGDTAEVPAVLLRPDSSRSEILGPLSVILAGVLAVVAVAIAVNWGMNHRDTPAALPTARPPALGSQPLAPADQGYFPTPSAAASASPSASPSRSTPAPTKAPAPAPTATAAPANTLAISRAQVPGRVDLSAEGRRDWVHWGLGGTFSLERRQAGGFAILEGTPVAPRRQHSSSPQRFAWVDGTPFARVSGTVSGIRTCGDKNGFTFTAPAGPAVQTLRLYVGVEQASGRLDARLSTGGKSVRGALEARSGLTTAVFTMTYKSAKPALLKISWLTDRAFSSSCGGVAIQAATLR